MYVCTYIITLHMVEVSPHHGPQTSHFYFFRPPSYSFLRSLPLSLPQGSLPNVLMHAAIPAYNPSSCKASHSPDCPPHKRMAPKRCARIGKPLSSARPTDLAQHGLYEMAGCRYHGARAPNLGHVRSDQITLHELYRYIVAFELRAQRRSPVLEEGFAATVRGQERGGKQPAEGAHGQDQATTARYHSWNYKLADTERGHVIDSDNVVDFLL